MPRKYKEGEKIEILATMNQAQEVLCLSCTYHFIFNLFVLPYIGLTAPCALLQFDRACEGGQLYNGAPRTKAACGIAGKVSTIGIAKLHEVSASFVGERQSCFGKPVHKLPLVVKTLLNVHSDFLPKLV